MKNKPSVRGTKSDAFRGSIRPDRLQLRLFTVDKVTIASSSWQTKDVCSSYWRFYRNDTEGASVRVYLADGTTQLLPLEAQQMYLIPARVRFDCQCDAVAIEHFYIHFEVGGLPGFLLRKLFDKPIHLLNPVSMMEQVKAILKIVQHAKSNTDANLSLFCRTKAILYEALAQSLEGVSLVERERHLARAVFLEPVLPALEMIEKRYAEPLLNDVLARSCYCSEDYFIRRFKECVGETPARYLQQRRLEVAANRLLFTADSIEKIATDCGFGNRFYFTRVFTSQIGMAPASYRKRIHV